MKIGEKNVGVRDKNLRMVLGSVLLLGSILGLVGSPWRYLLLLIGIICLITGIIGTCPLYSILGINTLGKGSMNKHTR